MSRSKHTRPARIIAADRVQAPRAKRSSERPAYQAVGERVATCYEDEGGAFGGAFGELGMAAAESDLSREANYGKLPRIKVQRTRKGFCHPASAVDIKAMLNYFGALSYYGVREIHLAQRSETSMSAQVVLAELSIPGKIILYEQPEPPWLVAAPLCQDELELLRTAGADIETSDDGSRSKILWSPANLKCFMLFEGLMHEVGHHIIQQFKGKRTAQVLRQRDHELLARNFARRCREEYGEIFMEAHPQCE